MFLLPDSINDNGWPILFPAFSIVGIWILINGISLIVLGIKGFQLPNFFSSETSSDINDETPKPEEFQTFNEEKWRGYALLVLIFLFYFLFCGLDLMFQSKLYTFALCGPLGM